MTVDLGGLSNFQGSTSLTGHGYMLYDGPHRAERAGCLIETSNLVKLRLERGRYRERMELKFIFEDLPDEANRVTAGQRRPHLPRVQWGSHSAYAQRGLQALDAQLSRLLAPLPVERVVSRERNETESHILGTTVMGSSSEDSLVDRNLVHHGVSGLLVLGGSVFPTCPPANPTLTICALSLWAATQALA